MRFVLASASPARLRVLEAAGLTPEVIVSGVDEDAVTGTPSNVALTLPRKRRRPLLRPSLGARSSSDVTPYSTWLANHWVSQRAARTRLLGGETCADVRGSLLTGHCLIRTDTGQQLSAIASTAVTFGHASDEEIAAYVRPVNRSRLRVRSRSTAWAAGSSIVSMVTTPTSSASHCQRFADCSTTWTFPSPTLWRPLPLPSGRQEVVVNEADGGRVRAAMRPTHPVNSATRWR